MSENPFMRDSLKDYKQYVSPFKEYKDGAVTYVTKMLGLDREAADYYVTQVLKESSIKDPEIEFVARDSKTFDAVRKKGSLLKYIERTKNNNEIFAPSLTTYLHPTKLESFQKQFIQNNLSKRTVTKKKMAEAKIDGRHDDFVYYNVLQKVLKIFNNALSGAYAVGSTALFNPSAHYTLTSTTRSVASIGNAVTEMMVAGNRYYKDYDTVIEAISMTITYADLKAIKKAIKKFKLHIPTVEEMMEVTLRSSRLYWKSKEKEENIAKYLSKLNEEERCAYTYINDFYHLRKFNDKLARSLLGSLSKRCTGDYDFEDYSVLFESEEFVLNTAYHVCSRDFEGKKADFEVLKDQPEMDALVSTVKNINRVMSAAGDLIRPLFCSDIMPIHISDMKDVLRRAIVLSDTDSTCGTYEEYIKWYYGAYVFTPESIALSAAIMMINGETISHFLKVLTANMNVELSVRDILSMKNEFFWPIMTPANVSKHYYAGVKIQEGRVYKELDRELKGVHLHANKIPIKYKQKVLELINHIEDTLTSGNKLVLSQIINGVIQLEDEVLKDLRNLKTSPLKVAKIKPHKEYTLDEEESKYRYHILWNKIFAEKYGKIREPEYTTYEIPIKLKKKKDIKEFIENGNGCPIIRKKLGELILKQFSNGVETLPIPQDIGIDKGIPEELLTVLDYRKTATLALKPFYIILETIGIYRHPEMLLTEYINMK